MAEETASIEAQIGDLIMGAETPSEAPQEPQEEPLGEVAPDGEVAADGDSGAQEASDDAVGDQSADEAPENADNDVGDVGFVEFEFEGQLYEGPEALKEAVLRNADYTQKTQDLASQRKEVEIQLGTIENTRKQFEFYQSIQEDVLKAHQLEQNAGQYHQYLKDNLDALSSTDIEKIRFAIDEANNERTTLVNGLQQKNLEHQQALEQSVKELRDKSTEVLRQKIPSWGHETQQATDEYAKSLGVPEERVATIIDPVEREILYKAMKYDQLQADKPAAVKKVGESPTIKPKSRNPMPEDVKQKLNLRKKLNSPNLSAKDKAKLIEEDFGRRFG